MNTKYRTKGEEVEAIQWTGRNHTAVCDFCADLVAQNTAQGGRGEPWLAFDGRRVDRPELNEVLIRTPGFGVLTVKAGQWIVRRGAYGYYVTTKETFEATFEVVPEVERRTESERVQKMEDQIAKLIAERGKLRRALEVLVDVTGIEDLRKMKAFLLELPMTDESSKAIMAINALMETEGGA